MSYTFDSMRQCSATLGIPIALLRAAKAGGCAGFKRGSRVNAVEFLRWHFDPKRDKHGAEDWSRELRKHQAGREQLKLQRERGELVDFRLAAYLFAEICNGSVDLIQRRLCSELPPSLIGLATPEAVAKKLKCVPEDLRQWFLSKWSSYRAGLPPQVPAAPPVEAKP